jgi:hypothetical protein
MDKYMPWRQTSSQERCDTHSKYWMVIQRLLHFSIEDQDAVQDTSRAWLFSNLYGSVTGEGDNAFDLTLWGGEGLLILMMWIGLLRRTVIA